jgi:O-antigen/teichoic acid export membrane protein
MRSISSTEPISIHDIKTPQTAGALSLRINVSWTFAGNVIYTASQWGILVIIAKIGIPEQVGQFTLGIAVTAPILIFSMLSLRQLQATDVKNEYTFHEYLTVRLVTTLIAFTALGFLVWVSKFEFHQLVIILLIGLAKGFEAISDICLGLFQKHERMDRVALSFIIKAFLSLIFVFIAFNTTHDVSWASASLLLAWLIVLISFDLKNVRKILKENEPPERLKNWLKPHWDMRRYVKLVVYSLPLGFAALLITLNSNIPRYFIEYYSGDKSLGIFSALVYLLYAGNTVISAIGQSACPRLARYYQTHDYTKFTALLIKFVLFGAGLGLTGIVLAIFFGKEILTFIYQPEYAQYQDVFIWVMAGGGIMYMCSFLGFGMTASRNLKIQPVLYGVSVFLSFLVGIWVIPEHGILGAGWLLTFVAGIQFLLTFFVIRSALKKNNLNL